MTHAPNSIEGFYATYLTGAMGSSFAIFTFREGKIAGADIGAGKYDGTYTVDPKTNLVHCLIDFVLPVGQPSITGAMAQAEPLRLKVPLALPSTIDPKEVFRIETPIGPVNARLEKIRGF